jgi:hypothetical protein
MCHWANTFRSLLTLRLYAVRESQNSTRAGLKLYPQRPTQNRCNSRNLGSLPRSEWEQRFKDGHFLLLIILIFHSFTQGRPVITFTQGRPVITHGEEHV